MTSGSPRIVATRSVYKGWNDFDIVTVEAPDRHGGWHRLEREIIDHGDAGVVLIVDRGRDVAILVRQWRAPLLAVGADPFLLEACAGIIDPGESPEDGARREAEEETGLKLGAMHKVAAVFPSAGTLTECMHLFIAEVADDQRAVSGRGNPHEGEDIEVVELPLSELFARARSGAIEDAKTLILVQHLMLESFGSENPSGA